MNVALRQALSAAGVLACVALALGAAASTALSLSDQRAGFALLNEQLAALLSREKRLKPEPGRDVDASPLFVAKTITLAGAAMQQRLEAAVAGANGRLVSSRVEFGPRGDERRIAISLELTIAEADMQALLYDLETGRPYLFVEDVEARAPESGGVAGSGAMRVSLEVSGQWSGLK